MNFDLDYIRPRLVFLSLLKLRSGTQADDCAVCWTPPAL